MKGPDEQSCRPIDRPAHPGSTRWWGRRSGTAVLLGFTVGAGTVGCQTQQAQQRNVRELQITETQGYVELITRRRAQEQYSRLGAGDTLSHETIFEENIQLEVDGYSYHPNLFEFTLAGLFGLLQHEYSEDATGSNRYGRDSGTVQEFDFTGTILKRKKYPGNVYARREQSLEPRIFRPSIETTVNNYGVLWQYLSDKVPTSFEFRHDDIYLDPLDTEEEDGRRTNTGLRFETGYNFTEHNTLSLLYEHESTSEQPYELDLDTDELTLSHRLDFGEQYRHRLDSELNYFDQRGTFDTERLRWRENLRLKHSDTLRSMYRFEALDRTRGSLTGIPPIEERAYLLSGTIEHKLYESLVSQLHGFAQMQDFRSGAEIARYHVEGGVDYRKRNSWGLLRANYRAVAEREDRRGGAINAEIRDEQHTFRDPDPVTLNNPNIDTGSIVITAQDGFTFYQLGRDYTLRTLGDRVEIERVLTGRIVDGQSVLVDYVFNLGGDFTLDTVNQDFMIRQDFDFGLSPYYRLRWQDQSISPRSATGTVPEDITAHIFGAEFRWRSFRLSGEYEDYNSTINPFEAIRWNASYSHRFKTGAQGSLRANWSNVSHGYPRERETNLFSTEGRYRHPLTRNLIVEGAVIYRNGTDTLTGDSEGVDVDLSLEWFVRQTELRITYEFGRFDDSLARNDSSTLYFQLRRRF